MLFLTSKAKCFSFKLKIRQRGSFVHSSEVCVHVSAREATLNESKTATAKPETVLENLLPLTHDGDATLRKCKKNFFSVYK